GYGSSVLRFNALAFDNFVNQQSGYVTPEQFSKLTLEDVRKFYQTYYTPSNASIVLVGDFDAAKARERVEHFFGGIPTRPAPPPADPREPGRNAERRETVAEPGVPAALVLLAWQGPSANDPHL